MACALTSSYILDCRDNVGGVKKVYFTELANVTSFTSASGVITAITMVSTKVFRVYELERETGEFTENITTSAENGTLFYEQDLTVPIRKLSATLSSEIKLLAQNRLVAIVLDRNGKYFVAGKNNGMELEPSTGKSGKAMGDYNGYNLVFKGKEEDFAFETSGAVVAGVI